MGHPPRASAIDSQTGAPRPRPPRRGPSPIAAWRCPGGGSDRPPGSEPRRRRVSARTAPARGLEVSGRGSRTPGRRPGARCRRPRRRSRPSPAAAARRGPPSRRGPPGWPRWGSNRRWPDRPAVLFSATRAAAVTCGIMNPEFRPGLGRQERRQAGERRIDQHGDPPLGQRADLAERDGDHVGGERDRLGVEVAAGERLVGLGEDQRVVGDAVGLDLERLGRVAEQVEDRAHHLGLAAQAVRVLHPVVVGQVRRPDGASRPSGRARPPRPRSGRGGRAGAMDAVVERRVRALGRVGRERAGDQGRPEERPRPRTAPARA